MPNLPPVVYSTTKAEDSATEITTLENGLKVASEKKFGHFCTIGGKENAYEFVKLGRFHCIS